MYSIHLQTKKWIHRMLYFAVDVAMLNAHVTYNEVRAAIKKGTDYGRYLFGWGRYLLKSRCSGFSQPRI